MQEERNPLERKEAEKRPASVRLTLLGESWYEGNLQSRKTIKSHSKNKFQSQLIISGESRTPSITAALYETRLR